MFSKKKLELLVLASINDAPVYVRGEFETSTGRRLSLESWERCNNNVLNFVQDIIFEKGDFFGCSFKIEPQSEFAFRKISELGDEKVSLYKAWLNDEKLQFFSLPDDEWIDIEAFDSKDICPLSFFFDTNFQRLRIKPEPIKHTLYIEVPSYVEEEYSNKTSGKVSYPNIKSIWVMEGDSPSSIEGDWVKTEKVAYF